MRKTGTVLLCLMILALPVAAAEQFTVSHNEDSDGSGEEAAQGIWENIKQFLKDMLPAPVVFFFEQFGGENNESSSENQN